MVQTISSFPVFFLCIFFSIKQNYLPLIQPFTAKAPTRRLDVKIEYSKFDSEKPLIFTVDISL